MVQINPDQLFAMMGKLQAELMVLRDENAALEAKNKILEGQLALRPANRAERRRKTKDS